MNVKFDLNQSDRDDLSATFLDPVRGQILKKSVLIRRHSSRWPSLERDLSNGALNGLKLVAHAYHGHWFENDVLNWGRSEGKYADSLTDDLRAATSLGAMSRHLMGR